jgi:hypothetical protein
MTHIVVDHYPQATCTTSAPNTRAAHKAASRLAFRHLTSAR